MGIERFLRFIETAIIGFIGGYLFTLAKLPLPWVLGALTFVILWQGLTRRVCYWPISFRNGGFMVLGMYFGLYFTMDTLVTLGPYFFPYFFATIGLVIFSIAISIYVTRWITVDKITSVLGSTPGGLTEMIVASEQLKAHTPFVLMFQTVRLLTVLFIVPSSIIFYFNQHGQSKYELTQATVFEFGGFSLLWFIVPAVLGFLLRGKIPAGMVVVPLITTAVMNISPIPLAMLPPILIICAQVAVGVGLGANISIRDLKAGGKYCFVYFGVSLAITFIAFCLGLLLAYFTTLSVETALLSIAPGGLIEMVLTASIVGGDPAIVSALQLVRLVVIVLLVPSFLKWYSTKTETKDVA